MLSINGALDSGRNHTEADQLVQFVRSNLRAPAVLKLQLYPAVELLCWHRSLVDDFEGSKLSCPVELQGYLLRQSNPQGNALLTHNLRLRQKSFYIIALNDLVC